MSLPQLLNDAVKALHMTVPDAAELFLIPVCAGTFAKRPVHIPLDIRNVIFRKQPVNEINDESDDLRIGQIQHILISSLQHGAGRITVDPVGMGAVQIAVFINHFRLDPDAEVHSQSLYTVN